MLAVLAVLAVLAALAALLPAAAAAQPSNAEVPLEREVDLRLADAPTTFLDVVDALAPGDPLDVHVRFAFERELAWGRIERESGTPGVWHGVADHRRRVSTLHLGLDVGLARDLALRVRVPVVLSDERRLARPAGVSASEAEARLGEPVPVPGAAPTDAPLFDLPFRADDRSGIPRLTLGLAWGITRAERVPRRPIVVLVADAHFAVSEPARACAADPEDGTEATCRGDGPGIGDGTHGLRAEGRVGWRSRYVEPYGALGASVSWPGRARELYARGDLEGYAQTLPPREVDLTLGAAVVPWEDPERAQRLVVDARVSAVWVSAGRTYSPLFDALGTSSHPALATPRAPCAGCAPEVPFEGLTDADAHGRLAGELQVELRAARYVRFAVGTGLAWTTPHALTGTAPCHAGAGADADDPRRAGCEEGISDPHHRSAIDLPGQRFRSVDALVFRLFAEAVAQF